MSKVCTTAEQNINNHTRSCGFRQEKMRQRLLPRIKLLLAEGLAVGALVFGGVHLVGTHQDPVQGAVVLVLTVISTLLDGTFDTLVCVTIHSNFLLLFIVSSSMCGLFGNYAGMYFQGCICTIFMIWLKKEIKGEASPQPPKGETAMQER